MVAFKPALLLLLLTALSNSNLWDNIFSETLASSPILLSESINFKFPIKYQGFELQGNFDYNHDFKLITLTVTKYLFIVPLQVFRLQIQLQKYLLSIISPLQQCTKYRLVLTQTDKSSMNKFPLQSKIFLVNILFKYTQRYGKNNAYNQYVLMPDLILQHEEEHQQYEVNPILIVSQKGNIVKIYEDREKKNVVPFGLKSNVGKVMQCEGEVQELTKQDLYDMVRKSIENKDYEKIPGFDSSKIPKIPDLPDIDISKLPINFNK